MPLFRDENAFTTAEQRSIISGMTMSDLQKEVLDSREKIKAIT